MNHAAQLQRVAHVMEKMQPEEWDIAEMIAVIQRGEQELRKLEAVKDAAEYYFNNPAKRIGNEDKNRRRVIAALAAVESE